MTGEQLNPTQRRRVSMSEGPVHLVREVTGSSSLPPPGKQPRTVWRVPHFWGGVTERETVEGSRGEKQKKEGSPIAT